MSLFRLSLAPVLTALLASCVPGGEEPERAGDQAQALWAGAGYTTFDATVGGCLDSRDGFECHTYTSKDAVYLGGGPNTAGLPDGEYFFAVIAPGHMRSGFREGAEGNLSDVKAGGTRFDDGSGDTLEDRTFQVFRRQIWAHEGGHRIGKNAMGRPVLQVAPFDTADNRAGEYLLAICPTGAETPTECRFDAFRIQPAEPPELDAATASGMTYYDLNTNGQLDAGEPPLGGWLIDVTGAERSPFRTDEDGLFRATLHAGTHRFSQVPQVPGYGWMQTGNLVDQTRATPGAWVHLLRDKTYMVTVTGDAAVAGLFFGNVCVGPGGGHGIGFWGNKHGEALVQADDLAMLRALPLRAEDGSDFDPYGFDALHDWLRGANAKNMAYALSAQAAAMALSVHNGFVEPSALVHAPGVGVANVNGFNTVGGVLRAASDLLLHHPHPAKGSPEDAAQAMAKDALDAANGDTTFVQPDPESCPLPLPAF